MQPEFSLPCSQKHDIELLCEVVESGLHPHTLFIQDPN
jgi:hypothetical protein